MRIRAVFAALVFMSTGTIRSASAGNPPSNGTIVAENSVDCGTKAHKKEKTELLCQEYLVRTTTTEYHVRQEKQKDQALLPVNSNIKFVLDKDKMKFELEGKRYEFIVVSETSVAAPKQ